MRIKLLISYDGTDYCGWQKQGHAPGLKPSIQGTLESALARVFKAPINVSGSGRTDSGVHALGQIAHFDAPHDARQINIKMAMKAILPPSISVRQSWTAPPDFHANFSAKAKTYRYLISLAPTPSPILTRFALWRPHKLDIDRLNECSKFLLGKQDFKSFQSTGTELKSTVRTIYRAQWSMRSKHLLQFEVTGSGFLKQMVRNIVGTHLMFAKDNTPPQKMADLILAQDRTLAGSSASPQGLFLVKVYYPQDLDKRCLEF